MNISYVSNSQDPNTSSNKAVISVPTCRNDDIILAFISKNNQNAITTSPTGFVQLAAQNDNSTARAELWYKIATGSESGSFTFQWSGSVGNIGSIIVYRGIDPLDPFGATTTIRANNTSSTSVTATGLTPGVPRCMLVHISSNGRSSTPPTSPDTFTERYDTQISGSNWWHAGSDLIVTSTSATGNIVATQAASSTSITALVCLKPRKMRPPAWF